ncbi:MAG TPA: hypothetical protein VFA80_08520 [Xanthobacteraceae bacterium]|nr:hypothetical protein [Xanthobacteraceae bacterium]
MRERPVRLVEILVKDRRSAALSSLNKQIFRPESSILLFSGNGAAAQDRLTGPRAGHVADSTNCYRHDENYANLFDSRYFLDGFLRCPSAGLSHF